MKSYTDDDNNAALTIYKDKDGNYHVVNISLLFV